MRDPTGVVQDTSKMAYTGGKDYAARTNFTCMATSGDGYVAVGSQVSDPAAAPVHTPRR